MRTLALLLLSINKFLLNAKSKLRAGLLVIAGLIAVFVFGVNIAGGFQLLELKILNQFFQWRPSEGLESRIVIVTYDEFDITKIGKWPFPDTVVAQLIKTIRADQPRVIGLDMYRNLPIEPGYETLKLIFQSTPNLIGTEKFVHPSVSPPPALNYDDQVGFVDVAVDADGTVRRGLLAIEKFPEKIIYSFGAKVALKYLEAEGITPQLEEAREQKVRLGKARISPFRSQRGGYADIDVGGYQTLINYRCGDTCFRQVTMRDVLAGKYPKGLFKKRIVLVGSIAASLNDFFFSPYGKTSGIVIHANLISQIISGALDGRLFLQTYPKWLEGIWIFLWSIVGTVGIWRCLKVNGLDKSTDDTSPFLQIYPKWLTKIWRFIWAHITTTRIWRYFKGNGLNRAKFLIQTLNFLLLSICGLLASAYISFLFGWWLPILPTLSAFVVSSMVCIVYLSEQLRSISNIDDLTQIANRRYFDRFLLQNFHKKRDLSVILCDIDYFKAYNDTYGHQAGDECLKKVALAMTKAVRAYDLVARYGGEEFAVILPRANHQIALKVAERIVKNIRSLNVPHINSQVSACVTLSCGVASSSANGEYPNLDLLLSADKALYMAKKTGRDRFVSSLDLNATNP